MTECYTTMHQGADLNISVRASWDAREAYVEFGWLGSLITVYLTWDQLDRLIFMAGVVAREHDERTCTPVVDLTAQPAQHIDAINE